MDEETRKLHNSIMSKGQKYPEEVFISFCIVLMDRVKPKFDEFISGLDLSEDDKMEILKGFLEREAAMWESGTEEAMQIGIEVLKKLEDVVLDRLEVRPEIN